MKGSPGPTYRVEMGQLATARAGAPGAGAPGAGLAILDARKDSTMSNGVQEVTAFV